jgi:hypothetical protein
MYYKTITYYYNNNMNYYTILLYIDYLYMIPITIFSPLKTKPKLTSPKIVNHIDLVLSKSFMDKLFTKNK